MRKLLFFCLIMAGIMSAQAKTLVVYYSYTNNVNRIVAELTRRIKDWTMLPTITLSAVR